MELRSSPSVAPWTGHWPSEPQPVSAVLTCHVRVCRMSQMQGRPLANDVSSRTSYCMCSHSTVAHNYNNLFHLLLCKERGLTIPPRCGQMYHWIRKECKAELKWVIVAFWFHKTAFRELHLNKKYNTQLFFLPMEIMVMGWSQITPEEYNYSWVFCKTAKVLLTHTTDVLLICLIEP